MKITVVGTGYVGLVVGSCLAETGNTVSCLDTDENKIGGLLRNQLPIFEPGLHELVERNQSDGRLTFTTDASAAIPGSDVVFIAVGTPSGEDGNTDLAAVLRVAEMIGRELDREAVIVTKSTVPVGTAARVAEVIVARSRIPFHMCSNPEFLKEGAAIEDFLRPDRVVLGVESEFARSVMTELYAPFLRTGKPIVFMDIVSAELTKYVANGMLASRISFMNEIANLCEKLGANVDHVRRGVGSDSRIGSAFLFPGPGYGGSCFPKDVKALISRARAVNAPLRVLEAVDAANDIQRQVLFRKTVGVLGGNVRGKTVAIWGLAFKPQTDDMRESPSLVLIDSLLKDGCSVAVHDPEAMTEARRRLGDSVRYASSGYDALSGADALVVVTDWNEYRNPSFDRIRAELKTPILVDGRNLYDPDRIRSMGFTYVSIGRG